MAIIHIKQRHELTHDEARKRIEKVAEDLKHKLNADYQWDGDSLRFKRSGASGSIDLSDDQIELKIKLGMLLAPMKPKIERYITENFQSIFSKDKDDGQQA